MGNTKSTRRRQYERDGNELCGNHAVTFMQGYLAQHFYESKKYNKILASSIAEANEKIQLCIDELNRINNNVQSVGYVVDNIETKVDRKGMQMRVKRTKQDVTPQQDNVGSCKEELRRDM